MKQDSKKLETSSPSPEERGAGGEVPVAGETTDTTNWQAWYWLVLGALVVEVAFFTYLTRAFTA